jgi:aspartate aminotransferase
MAWLGESMAVVASETYTSTSAPIQYAAVRAFQGGIRIERYLRNARRILAALCGRVRERLVAAGVEVIAPDGAFYVFPGFSPHRASLARRGITTDRALCRRLLEETGVALLPGSDFGRPSEELTARLAYVDFDGNRTLAAAEEIPPDRDLEPGFVDTHCGQVLSGVEALVRWLGTR